MHTTLQDYRKIHTHTVSRVSFRRLTEGKKKKRRRVKVLRKTHAVQNIQKSAAISTETKEKQCLYIGHTHAHGTSGPVVAVAMVTGWLKASYLAVSSASHVDVKDDLPVVLGAVGPGGAAGGDRYASEASLLAKPSTHNTGNLLWAGWKNLEHGHGKYVNHVREQFKYKLVCVKCGAPLKNERLKCIHR